MGLLDRIRGREDDGESRASLENPSTSLSNPASWLVGLFGGGNTPSGVSINEDNALEVAAVWACINNISNTIAALPLKVYRGSGDERQEDTNSPLYKLLHSAPVPLGSTDTVGDTLKPLSSYDWRRQILVRVLRKGRHLTFIRRDRSGRVAALEPVDAISIAAERKAGAFQYEVTLRDRNRKVTFAPEEVLDFKAMPADDGLGVWSPVMRCANAIGLAKALEDYGARFFANDARPGLVIEMSGRLSDGGAARLKKSIEEKFRGNDNSHKTLVMEEGAKLHEVGVQPEHAQFLESRRFQLEEICRAFNMPPMMIQDLTHGTYSNTEQQDLHYTKHTVSPWLIMMEQELNLKLGTSNDRYVEFVVEGLLRGDFKTRMEGYAKAIQNAVYTPNEARKREGLPDKDGGDDLLIQQNMTPTDKLPDLVGSGSDGEEGEGDAHE